MSPIPPPPVPQKLQEMLKDYPQHLEELQKALNSVVEKPPHGTPPFEMAVWMLEDTLSAFMVDAREKLKAAEASGDAQAIAKAEEKRSVMGRALANMWMPDLRAYFEAHKEAFL